MLAKRFSSNPLIVPSDVFPSRDDFEVVGVFNPAVIEYNDEVLLLLRVAERPKNKSEDEEIAPIYNPQTKQIDLLRVPHNDPVLKLIDSRVFRYNGQIYLTSISHLRIAHSKDGRNFVVEPAPTILPSLDYETYGIEDARITRLEGMYYTTYKAVSSNGICTVLLGTRDFQRFSPKSVIFPDAITNVVLFDEKINGRFYALIRPFPAFIGKPAIWLCSSEDLIHWGDYKNIIQPRDSMFDSQRVGASCVPIKTDRGWLEIYHGADENDKYCLGAVLLDSARPWKIIGRSAEPLMQPEADYEKKGFFGNVVFSCGAIVGGKGSITIYYGASDNFVAAANTTIGKILDTLK
jgi:beta-1,2-mannobiose phosphorylase / 1,2-beta-oligomannan phosphorylase